MNTTSKIKIGDKFSYLTVIKKTDNRAANGCVIWICQCTCKKLTLASTGNLRSKSVKSCGCLVKKRAKETHTTHGMSKSIEFSTWHSMKSRCYDNNATRYERYGGRGIAICRRWRNSFENFYKDMKNKPKNMSIDRIDNNGPYGKWNCK